MIYQSQAEVDEALAYWQKVLRLQDWDILARVTRQSEMNCTDASATCQVVMFRKQAQIKLLDPTDYDRALWKQDHEESLVHELLHLHYEPLFWAQPEKDRNDNWKVAEEQAICSIASGLVARKREIEECGPRITFEELSEISGLSPLDRGVRSEVTEE